MSVLYVPVGVGTFHMESAQDTFSRSLNLLQNLTPDLLAPEHILFSPEETEAFCDSQRASLVVFQNITFANGEYAARLAGKFHAPAVLWAVREPVIDGSRLRLNSLTGAFSASYSLHGSGQPPLDFVFGNPEEEAVIHKLKTAIRAAELWDKLNGLVLLTVGHTPEGFDFGTASNAELEETFGIRQIFMETREMMEKARSYSPEVEQETLTEIQKTLPGLPAVPEENRTAFARLYRAYRDTVRETGAGMVASRCWPDFFTSYGTPVCGVLSLLNSEGIPASCESDAFGAVSMYIGSQLTGKPAFLGDPVSLDETEGTITFWHCGMAPCSLAHPNEGPALGVHPNRKIGPTMEFGCAPFPQATIFRVGRRPDGSFRFFIEPGKIPDKPRQFLGTSVVVQTRRPAEEIVSEAVAGGWEPHYCVLYGDVTTELSLLEKLL